MNSINNYTIYPFHFQQPLLHNGSSPALMFALKPVPFSIINTVVIQEFVDSMLSDEYYIMLLYYVSRGPLQHNKQTTNAAFAD